MWTYKTDTARGWKYTVTSNRFIIRITGGSITILDRESAQLLRRHKGHHYLYTGDIRPDELQCYALENGKHFYVYSLENFELIRRITLPRGYDCVDMYGHYTPDGARICIPAHKWIGNEYLGQGHYEYVMFHYDAQTLALLEKVPIKDPNVHWWALEEPNVQIDPRDVELIRRVSRIVEDNAENKAFWDGLQDPDAEDPAVAEIMALVFGDIGDPE